ncbi:MAG: tyrosine-protein kinase family protein, partial [Flavobacteriales bacterium]
TVSDNVVIDEARCSDEPISPKKSMVYLLGLLAGCGLPSLYILLISLLDNRIKDRLDISRVTSIPFLGIVPHHKESSYVVVENNSNSAIAESFRSIRTNVSFMIREDALKPEVSPKVIQLTSAVGAEGKSFCSINLAASFALGGAKTIVVGLDLRKPKLAEYFNMSNEVGASSVLASIATEEEAIVSSEMANLDIMVAGPIPPNPSELLMSESMSSLLTSLAQKYDKIVLDTPPIGLVTDSLIISEHSATTIYVVRQNTSSIASLDYINDLYKTNKISSVSILLNDVKTTKFGYGNGYGYGYGNGYYSDSVPDKNPVARFIDKLF